MSSFHGAFATGVACQQGTLTLPDTWFRPPLWDLLVLQLLRPDSSNLAMSLLDFSPRIHLGTFSILLERASFVSVCMLNMTYLSPFDLRRDPGGLRMRIGPPHVQRVIKGDLMGRFFDITVKSVAHVGA